MVALPHRAARHYIRQRSIGIEGAPDAGPFVSDGEPALHRSIQERVPAGATLLYLGDQNLALIKPFLFDFRRNKLLFHDIPGCISPPPGIPPHPVGPALAGYLRAQGVRYVVFHEERDTTEQLMAASRAMSGSDNWIASFLVNDSRITDIMGRYAKTYGRYENGGVVLLDLEDGGLAAREDDPAASGPVKASTLGAPTTGGTGRRP